MKCQEKGKKVFVSIGGASSNTSFQTGVKSREEASKAATLMWDLFGQGENLKSLRSLGKEVVVDEIGNYLVPQEILISWLMVNDRSWGRLTR